MLETKTHTHKKRCNHWTWFTVGMWTCWFASLKPGCCCCFFASFVLLFWSSVGNEVSALWNENGKVAKTLFQRIFFSGFVLFSFCFVLAQEKKYICMKQVKKKWKRKNYGEVTKWKWKYLKEHIYTVHALVVVWFNANKIALPRALSKLD